MTSRHIVNARSFFRVIDPAYGDRAYEIIGNEVGPTRTGAVPPSHPISLTRPRSGFGPPLSVWLASWLGVSFVFVCSVGVGPCSPTGSTLLSVPVY